MTSKMSTIQNKVRPVLKKYRVRRASLFGSAVTGKISKNSDVDFLVELPSNSSLLDLSGLKIDLEEILDRKVDVVTFNSLHHLLKDRILKEQVPIL